VAFVSLLQTARIELLVDVRAYPLSRRHPQFSREPLAHSLSQYAIRYDWQGRGLGGMRKGGYAAHMDSALFAAAAQGLVEASRAQAICIMCAEADPADCHRSHISDWLAARGKRVLHILGPGKIHDHAARLF
jgi:uncharacterized protein (DUF488 family)